MRQSGTATDNEVVQNVGIEAPLQILPKSRNCCAKAFPTHAENLAWTDDRRLQQDSRGASKLENAGLASGNFKQFRSSSWEQMQRASASNKENAAGLCNKNSFRVFALKFPLNFMKFGAASINFRIQSFSIVTWYPSSRTHNLGSFGGEYDFWRQNGPKKFEPGALSSLRNSKPLRPRKSSSFLVNSTVGQRMLPFHEISKWNEIEGLRMD